VNEIQGIGQQNANFRPGIIQNKGRNFQDTLKDYLNDVNNLIKDANVSVDKMARGEVKDIHEVMVAVEKASVGLEMVVEIRNKLLESYREIMRMQI
jgi:flagellar hook-basal body complex protein FliE